MFLEKLDEDRLVEPVAARVEEERVGAPGLCGEPVPDPVAEGDGGFGEAHKQDGPGQVGGNLARQGVVHLRHEGGPDRDVAPEDF